MGEIFSLEWIPATAGFSGCVLYSKLIERLWLDVRKLRIPLNRLPASFSEFRIALFSDIHLGFFFSGKDLSSVVKVVNELNPDTICFTGDFLNSVSSLKALESGVAALAELTAPFGKYAVLGNHDYMAGPNHVINGLERGGFHVLINKHAAIQKDGDRLFLTGLDSISKGKPNLETAIHGIPEAACNILLAHEPDIADAISKFPVSLQLSGHSHGGQVRLPFIGPVITTGLGRKYHSGIYKINELILYTNRGLGTTVLPVRFMCRPEITIITLAHNLP
ncbi:putative metallophosphoesterase [Pelotomaculum schinkii]|uniref:Putative metallophosphoesterase n=1 Tax=Pelotomaculum schinkii TaxID=78350 RepID=A0A4Y7R9U8_9FIRM|nr:metallophosphoesterase [Pelotomaculum schinkii]TEB05552.1 putative metallophosphoesterase [Pelotomaculum schinkii]